MRTSVTVLSDDRNANSETSAWILVFEYARILALAHLSVTVDQLKLVAYFVFSYLGHIASVFTISVCDRLSH